MIAHLATNKQIQIQIFQKSTRHNHQYRREHDESEV